MIKLSHLFCLLLALMPAANGFAMRCQQSLVFEGDTKYMVEKKCGEPLSKDINSTPELLYNQSGGVYGSVVNDFEIWTYQFSSTDFIYEVTFRDGKVISITANRP